MMLDTAPLSPAIGVVVRNVDLSRKLDDATRAALRAAFYDNGILLIRGQTLDEDKLVIAGSWIGELTKRGRPNAVRREDNPFITKVSNIRENGRLIGSLPDGEILFHSDSAFYEKPQRASFLYAVEIPSRGGNTRFANLCKAYELLPQGLKRRVEGLKAVQSYDYATYEKEDRAAGHTNIREAVHPLVFRHPDTGRKILYATHLMTKRIEGLPKDESDALLAELRAYTEHPSIIYEHVWQPGDFLAWDNLSSAHARTDFSAAERRLLLRGAILGDYRPAPATADAIG